MPLGKRIQEAALHAHARQRSVLRLDLLAQPPPQLLEVLEPHRLRQLVVDGRLQLGDRVTLTRGRDDLEGAAKGARGG